MSFKQHLEEMSFENLIQLWNEYASYQVTNEYIYDSIEEFAELYSEEGVELARKLLFGNVDNWYDKVYLDGYGNFQSCYSVESSPIDIDTLVDWMTEINHPTYTDWSDEQPSFAEWLEDTYNASELFALWAEYMKEGTEFNLVYLADTIADNEGDEYLDYKKEILG